MKLLILEDSQGLAKILALQIKKSIDIEIDLAYTLAEAKALIERRTYALAVVDLHLPDSQEDQIVDYFVDKSLPIIIMTGSYDEKLQAHISQKRIIDYIVKESTETIHYLIDKIHRVLKNQNHLALIVDDSRTYRKQIKQILDTQLLNTITAEDGEEALELLRTHPNITLVITDYNMPKVDGLELITDIRKLYKKESFPILGISSDVESSIKFLKHGVNDFIKKPFFKEEMSTRVNNLLDALENVQSLKNIANTDFLTGVSNRKHFYQEMGAYYHKAKRDKTPLALIMIDIDHFKKVNDTHGHDIGDKVIQSLANTIQENIKGRDIIARFGGEEFCIALKDIQALAAFKFFDALRERISQLSIMIGDATEIRYTISAGIVTNYHDNLEEMVVESDKQLYHAKNSGRNKVCIDTELTLA
jgi:diguanylate cyclase (GGDEF)-like protein